MQIGVAVADEKNLEVHLAGAGITIQPEIGIDAVFFKGRMLALHGEKGHLNVAVLKIMYVHC